MSVKNDTQVLGGGRRLYRGLPRKVTVGVEGNPLSAAGSDEKEFQVLSGLIISVSCYHSTTLLRCAGRLRVSEVFRTAESISNRGNDRNTFESSTYDSAQHV